MFFHVHLNALKIKFTKSKSQEENRFHMYYSNFHFRSFSHLLYELCAFYLIHMIVSCRKNVKLALTSHPRPTIKIGNREKKNGVHSTNSSRAGKTVKSQLRIISEWTNGTMRPIGGSDSATNTNLTIFSVFLGPVEHVKMLRSFNLNAIENVEIII